MKFFYDFSNSRLLIEEQDTRWFLSETIVYNFIILDILFYIISIKRFENEKYYKQKKKKLYFESYIGKSYFAKFEIDLLLKEVSHFERNFFSKLSWKFKIK